MNSKDMVCYIACFYRENPERGYRITFDDFRRMSISATGLADAVMQATRALETRLGQMWTGGETIPEPTALEDVQEKHRREKAPPVLFVPIVVHARGHRVRVNISLDSIKLDAITEYARTLGKSRSEALVHAALRAIELDR